MKLLTKHQLLAVRLLEWIPILGFLFVIISTLVVIHKNKTIYTNLLYMPIGLIRFYGLINMFYHGYLLHYFITIMLL